MIGKGRVGVLIFEEGLVGCDILSTSNLARRYCVGLDDYIGIVLDEYIGIVLDDDMAPHS